MQQQAQGTQLWPGGQGAHYQDRSQLFQPSTNLGQNNGVQQKSRNPPPVHSTPNVHGRQKNNGYGTANSNYNNNNQVPSASQGQNGQGNTGYAPAPRTVYFEDETGNRNRYGNQNGQFQQNPNPNPPYALDFEEQGFNGNFVLDDEGGDLYRIENNDGQYQNQNNGQNGNNGQNHNRNGQNNYRPPHQLCRRYGLHNESSFNTFEFDFKLACKMHRIP